MWILFELIIWLFLLSVGGFLLVEWKRTQSSVLRRVVTVVLACAWLVIFYGSFVEPRQLVVRTQEIHLSPEPTSVIRVALIADTHLGPYKGKGWLSEVVERINALHPDLVLLAGDYIANAPSEARGLEPLRGLVAPLGVYGVTGNHDYEDGGEAYVVDTLKQLGVQMLEDATVRIEYDGRTFVLAGVSDIWNEGSVFDTLEAVQPEDTVILLAHNPDVVLDPASAYADLVVAGHTHGGQIRLPFWGPVPQIPNVLGNAFDRGWFVYEGRQLYITSGVGETGPRARLFNPPEISLLSIGY